MCLVPFDTFIFSNCYQFNSGEKVQAKSLEVLNVRFFSFLLLELGES